MNWAPAKEVVVEMETKGIKSRILFLEEENRQPSFSKSLPEKGRRARAREESHSTVFVFQCR